MKTTIEDKANQLGGVTRILSLVQARKSWVAWILGGVQILVCLLLLTKWLFITSYRLYLEDRTSIHTGDGMAWQQFTVEDNQVVPQILTEGSARLCFSVNFSKPSSICFGAKADAPASYEINLVQKGSRQLLNYGKLQRETSEKISLPAFKGLLEFHNEGPIIWSDLRITQTFDPTLHLLIFTILVLLTRLLKPRASAHGFALDSRQWPVRALFWVTIIGSALVTLVLLEIAMQILETRLPLPGIPLRRELGIVTQDPRWQQSRRYGRRLRPNLNTFLEWQYGDIVQLTFIPPEVSPGSRYRFPFRTDSEGFRNDRTRANILVAALGDSFTDSMTVPAESIWTNLLEQSLGRPVQNYGTAGFGPQQELYVLEDYAIHHHPRVIVVAYFAGNDLFDVEKTDQSEKSGKTIPQPLPGWKIKKVVPRYETFYAFALVSRAIHQLERTAVKIQSNPARDRVPSERSEDLKALSISGPLFDRGMFSIPINQHTLRFALMPPYLQTLIFPSTSLERMTGWTATRETFLKMKSLCEERSGTLIVMFIPFKSQVVLPLLQRSFQDEDLKEAFRFYFRQRPTDFDLAKMARNRLAQNELMERFCEESHIPLLDLTPVFQQKIESGRNLYFSDDSHWNAAGQEVAARELAKFLRDRGLDQ